MPYPRALHALPGVPGTYALQVEPEHSAFQGHFPGDPILSGLIQVDWAIRLGREAFCVTGLFSRLDHLKFKDPIRPAEAVDLSLSWDPITRQLAFSYTGRDGLKSRGTAVFAPVP